MRRRDFVKLSGLSALAPFRWSAAADVPGDLDKVSEPARQTPVVGRAEVIVCGAGPAGVSAAVAAARVGAKTLLLENNGCLGGISPIPRRKRGSNNLPSVPNPTISRCAL